MVMKCYFTDCLRNPFKVECIIKDEIDLDQSENSNTYTSAVLIFASEQHATCALNLNGITFLQKKLRISRKQPTTYSDWINTGLINKWDDLLPDWPVEGSCAEDLWREDHMTINYYSTLSVADATEETSSVLGSGGDISPEESMVADDRLVEYNSSLSFKFNAALKEEEENNELDYLRAELDNNDNDTLFDDMAQEMDYLIETDEDIRAMESQRDEPTINEDELVDKPTLYEYEPSYGITKSIWTEESLHNWGKIGNWGKSTNPSSQALVKESGSTDTAYSKGDELPSIKNTSAWFDIHQVRGWQSIDEWQPTERTCGINNTSNTLEINAEETSVGSNISRESLESPRTEPSGEVVQILTIPIPETTECNDKIKEEDLESTALVSLGSKSLAASNKSEVVSIDQSLKRVKRQKQRNTLIKSTLKQLRIRWEVLHDKKATALRVQMHWDTNRICVIVAMTKVNVARKAAALADSKLEVIMWHLDKRGL